MRGDAEWPLPDAEWEVTDDKSFLHYTVLRRELSLYPVNSGGVAEGMFFVVRNYVKTR